VLLAAFTYAPILRVAWDSLYDQQHATGKTSFVGLANYTALFSDKAFGQSVINNLVYAVGTVPLSIALALLFALAVQRSSRFNSVVRALLLFPSMVPLVAVASLFFFIFLPGVGLFDYYLGKLGLQGVNWLGDPDYALWSLIAITIWKNAGYYMLFYLAGLQTLPGEVLEAATIDGCNAWQRLRYVIVPLLAPTTAFVLVIALINVLTQVDHVIVLTKGGPSNSTKLVLYYIFEQAHENFAYGKAAAASLLSVSFLLALSVFSLKTMERGAHAAS
jgi:sn-glycerol 3-phosphate transport system permease protein